MIIALQDPFIEHRNDGDEAYNTTKRSNCRHEPLKLYITFPFHLSTTINITSPSILLTRILTPYLSHLIIIPHLIIHYPLPSPSLHLQLIIPPISPISSAHIRLSWHASPQHRMLLTPLHCDLVSSSKNGKRGFFSNTRYGVLDECFFGAGVLLNTR